VAKRQTKNGEVKDEIGRSIPLACADETVAVNFLEQLRWGKEKTHVCPHCGHADIYPMMDRQQPARRALAPFKSGEKPACPTSRRSF
jgi:hypothetical protein